jgi:hypothetical protein
MKAIGLLLTAALPHGGVFAQDADAERLRKAMAEVPANTFRFVGNRLVCKQDTPAPNYIACLRIGPLRVGDSYRAFRERDPKSWKETALEGGVSSSAFRIVATSDTNAYWVIGHRDDQIVTVQLTGNYSHPDLAFATIRLNDTEEKVLAMLGPPANIRVVKEIGGLLWDYLPIPISIELVHGRVYSIKVATPDLAPQPAQQGGGAGARP